MAEYYQGPPQPQRYQPQPGQNYGQPQAYQQRSPQQPSYPQYQSQQQYPQYAQQQYQQPQQHFQPQNTQPYVPPQQPYVPQQQYAQPPFQRAPPPVQQHQYQQAPLQRIPQQYSPNQPPLQRIPSAQQIPQLHRIPSAQQIRLPQPQYSHHAHSNSVPTVAYQQQPIQSTGPPIAPSAMQAAQHSPQRSATLPGPHNNIFPPQQPLSSYSHSNSSSPSPPSGARRPLPTPTKHQSIDLSRLPLSKPPSPVKQVEQPRRRASPPRFASGPPSPVKAQAPPLKVEEILPPLAAAVGSNQKFVPLWKRNSQIGNRSGPISAVDSANSTNGRPLPAAPTAPARSPYTIARRTSLHSRAASSHDDDGSDDDDEEETSESEGAESAPPSPQYGILDLPRKAGSASGAPPPAMPGATRSLPQRQATGELPQPPVMSRFGNGSSQLPRPPVMSGGSTGLPQPPSMSRNNGSSQLPQPPAMSRFGTSQGENTSMTLKFAAMSVDEARGASSSRFSSSNGGGTWPVDLPKLPHTPVSSSSGFSNGRENLDDPPPVSLRSNSGHSQARQPHQPVPVPGSLHRMQSQPSAPVAPPILKIESPAPLGGRDKKADIPRISFPDDDYDTKPPQIQVSVDPPAPSITTSAPPPIVFEVPGISFDAGPSGPSIAVSDDSQVSQQNKAKPVRPIFRGKGLICGGCGGNIIGKIVAAIGVKWHPECFKCTVCDELLEHVSSYEHDGRPYCHLDYHENFAPKCYHCKTAIVEERFISLDDPALGKRNYHEPHFFCSECGDPFMDPKYSSQRTGELNFSGDGVFADDDVGFVVYKGYPYCEACHVRLRLPKCKRCKKSIRDHMEAVEALGGKWCWECFVCSSCEKPFETPSFFQRNNNPYCEPCFTLILRNEI